MILGDRIRLSWHGLVVGAVLTSPVAWSEDPNKKPNLPADEIEALINRLTETDQEDIGYSSSTSGSAFLPLGTSDPYAILLGQEPQKPSDALKALVKLGTKALPKLLAHLKD